MCNTKPSTLLQYVDDLLLCSPSQQDSETGTANLHNFLASKGYWVSPAKAQLCLQAVSFLGFCLTPTSKALTMDQVQTLKDLPPPNDAQEILSFLGFIGFLDTGFLILPRWPAHCTRLPRRLPLVHSPLRPWSVTVFLLSGTPSFRLQPWPFQTLPNPSKPCHLFTDETSGIAKGVLTQLSGPIHQPIAYLSRQLDTTVRGWQPCL
jgi:hypothetical protein